MTAVTNYFDNFDVVGYRFGDNEDAVLYNNLSQYVDIIDLLKDNVSFYTTIQFNQEKDQTLFHIVCMALLITTSHSFC